VNNEERRVLVVDDYSIMRRIVRNLLKQIGFTNIDEAGDGASALDKMHKSAVDLVVSDWNMAPMSGLEFLKQLRADAHLKDTPFIMVTAESKRQNVVAARDAGANSYIVKPFKAETLLQKIEAVLNDN
jgi:two-component system, chemotaxis family, chemotaxis protein CheY